MNGDGLIYIDGRVMDAHELRLDARDEGLLYGLGLFETTRTFDGKPWLWDRHLSRLMRSANDLGLPLPSLLPDADMAAQFVSRLQNDYGVAGDVVLRLNVTPGWGTADVGDLVGRGAGRVWLSWRPLPPAAASVRLRTAEFFRISAADGWSPHKSFQYGTRWVARRQAIAAGYDDALLLDTIGLVLEATRANVFLKMNNRWTTPSLNGAVLPGIIRRVILDRHDWLAVREEGIHRRNAREIQEAFVCNSVRGVVPVTEIDRHAMDVGEDTRRVAELVSSYRGEDR